MKDELLPGTTRYNLWRRYRYLERRNDTSWASFEEFEKWSLENGHFRGAFLRKHDQDKPYGPDNAFWSGKPNYYYDTTQPKPVNEAVFCKTCAKRMDPALCTGKGCTDYQKWYIQNWNENIHVDVAELEAKKYLSAPEDNSKFRYEHPDIEREQKAKGEQGNVI